MLRTTLATALSAIALLAAPAFAEDADALFAQGQRLQAEARDLSRQTSSTDPQVKALNEQAQTALKQACELDHIQGCMSYGRSLGVGAFLDPDISTARYWAFGRACDLGDGEGCLQLGRARTPSMFGAENTPENWAGATAALTRACDTHELAEGCKRLSDILRNGRNPNKDGVAANEFLKRACGFGLDAPECAAWQ